MYKIRLTRNEKKRLASAKWLLVALGVAGVALVIWLAWVRPAQQRAGVDSFAKCKAAGNQIQETYPEICLTSDGKRFVNPAQAAAHSSLADQTLVPPTDPNMLYLNIEEWKVRVPLTQQTFDLSYTYLEDGAVERLHFTFKRLVQAGFCAGDAGITLTRSVNKHYPPFSPDNPMPTAQVGNYYYYVAYAGSPCYDTNNAQQVALVKQIVGDQSLTQAIAKLIGGLQVL